MATSFNSGFKLGTDMFTQAQRNSLAQEELALAKQRDARAEEEFGFRRDALVRERARDAEVDSLTQQLTRPNAENYALAPRGTGTGMGLRMGNQPAAEMPAEGLVMPQLDTGATAPGLRQGAAPVGGLRAPTMAERPMTFNQAPTGAAAEDILGRIALTKGDTAGFRNSQVAARGFREDDIFKERIKEFTGSPEQIGSTMSYLNQNSRSVTMGRPDKDGFVQLSVVKPDGDAAFARLTKQDQAKLYAAAGLMEVNPTRAFEMMSQVNKELAVAIAAENGMNVELTKSGNDVAAKKGTLANQRTELGIKRDSAAATAQYYRDRGAMERMGTAQYFTGQDGNTYASIPKMGKNGLQFETVKVNPEGVKMTKVGAGGPSKPVEVPEQGKIMMRDGKRYMTDGLGGEIEVNARGKALGVMPNDRDNFVTKTLGMPPAMANELEYSKDGRYILAPNGAEYDTQDPKDMKRIKDDVLAFAARDPDEYERRMLASRYPAPTGFGPRITARPAEGAPSIYAGPEAWAAYRAKQQQQ